MNTKQNILRRASFAGLVVTCASAALNAEEVEAEAGASEELVPYVVVATRTPLGLDRVSPSVSYVSADEMEQWQYRDLSGVLEQEAGMAVISSGAKGAQTSLFTRGTNSDHTAFFLDGRRLNTGFGNQYGLERLSLNNLSSVQIQKGASSVNYGSSGIGGVVDLRSRSAFDVEGNSSILSGETGSHNYTAGAFASAFSEGSLGVSVSGSALTTENDRKNDDYEYEGVNSRVDYLLTDYLSLEFLGQYDHTDKELPGSTASPTLNDEQETDDWLVSPGIRYATDELTVHLFYSHSESKIDLDQEKAAYDDFGGYLGHFPVSNDSEVKSDEVSLQADYSFSEALLITSGMVYRNDEVENSNLNTFNPLEDAIPYDERFEQFGIYAQALWLVTEAIELRGGIRYDDYSDYDSPVTGQLEALYHLHDTGLSFFAKYANSYAPPSPSDLAFDNDVINQAPANTDLDAEESDSYECGVRYIGLEDALTCTVVYFRNDIDDLIGYAYEADYSNWPDVIEITNDSYNVGSATTEGLEFSFDYSATQQLDLAVAYTYLTATDDDEDERLLRRPRHMLQLSANYQFTDSISAGVQGVGYFDREDYDAVTYERIDQEDSFVVNFVADWNINERFSVFARAENLLDESYEAVNGYPALGTTGYVGARFNF